MIRYVRVVARSLGKKPHVITGPDDQTTLSDEELKRKELAFFGPDRLEQRKALNGAAADTRVVLEVSDDGRTDWKKLKEF